MKRYRRSGHNKLNRCITDQVGEYPVTNRKSILLRLDPAVYDALARWAGDELRSSNAQIEFLLRRALAEAGRLPDTAGHLPRRGRPPKMAATRDSDANDVPRQPLIGAK
jgi:hypothetical protein